MQQLTYDLMLDHVHAMFRAVTGRDLPELKSPSPLPPGTDASELVSRRFAELDAWARLLPAVSAHVPPFSFRPPIDLIERDGELVVEIAIPGVTRESVQVEVAGGALVVYGVTGEDRPSGDRRNYRFAEIPRGPFRRTLALPSEVKTEPARFEVQNGIVQIRLSKLPTVSVAQA